MIKTITIEAVSIKTTKKDGTPYMWNDKKSNTTKPRTMVSVKYKDATTGPEGDWLMGWSYKAGSAAEALQAGQTVEIKYEESTKNNPDGSITIFKSWRFPKKEDKDAALIEQLQAQLAAAQAAPQTAGLNITGNPATSIQSPTNQVYPPQASVPSAVSMSQVHSPTPVSSGEAAVKDIPF